MDVYPPFLQQRNVCSLYRRTSSKSQTLRDVIKIKRNANIKKGYVRKSQTNEAEDGPSCYLPHFHVIREDRGTTKARIAFDSAARYKVVSWNNAMLTGPKLQEVVLEILLRFRDLLP